MVSASKRHAIMVTNLGNLIADNDKSFPEAAFLFAKISRPGKATNSPVYPAQGDCYLAKRAFV